jgi:hypothetical protein
LIEQRWATWAGLEPGRCKSCFCPDQLAVYYLLATGVIDTRKHPKLNGYTLNSENE